MSCSVPLIIAKHAAKQIGEEVNARPRDHHPQLAAITPLDVLCQIEVPLSGPPVLDGAAERKGRLVPAHLFDEVVAIRQVNGRRRVASRKVQHRAIGGYECSNVDGWQLRGTPDQPVEEHPAGGYASILLLGADALFGDPVEHGLKNQLVDREALLDEFGHDERQVPDRARPGLHAPFVLLPQECCRERPDGDYGDCNLGSHLECRTRSRIEHVAIRGRQRGGAW